MGTAAPRYEPGLIEQHAVELYTRAHTARLLWGAVGGAIGLAAAATAAFVLPATLPFPARAGFAVIVLAVAAGAGLLFGKRRSKELRVKAQMVLCDVHAQYGTLAVWRVLKERLPSAAPTWEELARPLLAAEPERPAPELPPVTVDPPAAVPALAAAPPVGALDLAPPVAAPDLAPLRAVESEVVETEPAEPEPVILEPVVAPVQAAPQFDQIAPPPVEPPLQPPPVLVRAAR